MATIDILELEEVLINTPIHVHSNEERTFENQRLRLATDIQVDGKLTFKNCYVTLANAHIRVSGKLLIQDCEIRNIKGHFLSLEDNAAAQLNSSYFIFSGLTTSKKGSVFAPESASLQIKDGMFYFEPITTLSKELLKLVPAANCLTYSTTSTDTDSGEIPLSNITKAPVINAVNGRIIGCSFRNFPCRTLTAREIIGCTFENCVKIECCGNNHTGSLRLSIFTRCHCVKVSDAPIIACEFNQHHEQLYIVNSDIKNCTFKNTQCRTDALIILEDGIISHCKFNDLELINDAYLVNAFGDVAVEDSHFTNCSTSRDDLELIHCGEMRGKLFKRYKEFDIIDHESCTGLDDIRHIDKN